MAQRSLVLTDSLVTAVNEKGKTDEETLQTLKVEGNVIRFAYENPKDRRTRVHEVDFVAERVDGVVLPIEVKFRKRVDAGDVAGLRHFSSKFDCPLSVVVTRDLSRWDERVRVLYVPLQNFLLAF